MATYETGSNELKMFDLQEQAYERFCSGEISQKELEDILETISMLSLSEYLTTTLEEKRNPRLPTDASSLGRASTERRLE